MYKEIEMGIKRALGGGLIEVKLFATQFYFKGFLLQHINENDYVYKKMA